MARKQSKKKGTSAKKAGKQQQQQQAANRKRMTAVILFAASVLTLFFAIVSAPDALLWNAIHNGLLGVFGFGAYFIPVLMAIVSIWIAMDKEDVSILKRLLPFIGIMLLSETVLAVFSYNVAGDSFGDAIRLAFDNGVHLFQGGGLNGGVLGIFFGYPLEYLMSDLGSKIILILVLFVLVMWVSKASLMTLVEPVRNTARMTKEKLRQAAERSEDDPEEDLPPAKRRKDRSSETPSQKPSRSPIDIDLGEGYRTPEEKDTKKAFSDAVDQVRTERNMPQIRIDDIIGRAMDNTADHDENHDDEEEVAMTHEEVRAEEAKVAKMIEENEVVVESYTYPPLSLLQKATAVNDRTAREEMQVNAELLEQTLKEFGISARVIDISRGPSVTRYELQPNAGVKISRITNLADDIALRLATTGVRIEAPIPNKAAIGIEVPNKTRGGVCIRELLDSDEFSNQSSRLAVALGRDISGQVVTADLAQMPHLLIAGTTGSGKSVCTNSMIQSVLFHSSPDEVRMILIDPKQVEFSMYNGIPHLLVPVVTNPRKAAGVLGWAVTEMVNRYNTFMENNVKDIKSYNKLAKTSDTLQTMPLILIVIDELSDLMMAAGKEVEDSIVRLAQMARAAGMHLVIATQRPSVDVITGLIKANIPSRLALTVASAVDSRTILDTGGAEKLLGRGDMLFHPVGLSKPIRVQGCFVSEEEITAVVEFLKTSSTAQYDEQVMDEIDRQAQATEKAEAKDEPSDSSDEMLPQAIQEVVDAGQASVSLLQRRLKVGYARAGRLIDEMEQRGIVGPYEGSKPRQVLITRQQWLEMQNNRPDSEEE